MDRPEFHSACISGDGPVRTSGEATDLLHALFQGDLLAPDLAAQMHQRFTPIGRLPPGRPLTEAGYGMGLMLGRIGDAGRAMGHSGDGPGSVSAVWHFPDLKPPLTVAAFTEGADVGAAESAAQATALGATAES